jgi:hypothetical protein
LRLTFQTVVRTYRKERVPRSSDLGPLNNYGLWTSMHNVATYFVIRPLTIFCKILDVDELNSPAVSARRRAIAEFKQRWSVIRWGIKNVLSQAPLCYGRHVKQLVPPTFAVVSTHQPALGPHGGLWPVLLMCNP